VTLGPAHVLLIGLLLACGKYGPPVRAAERKTEPEAKPSFEVPLPGVPAPEPRPAPAAPEPEREPPPEGSP
jgi:hypothetical protein